MPELLWPWMLLLLVLPWLARWAMPAYGERRSQALRLPMTAGDLTPSSRRRVAPGRLPVMLLLAWMLLVLAGARRRCSNRSPPHPNPRAN